MNYCNALLHGATEKSLNNLHRVQNKLARVVSNITTRQQHAVDLLRHLHWLPIRRRITFSVTTLCFKGYSLNQPRHLLDTFELDVSRRGLRHAAIDFLAVQIRQTPNRQMANRRMPIRRMPIRRMLIHRMSICRMQIRLMCNRLMPNRRMSFRQMQIH